jgi:murein L,D-transpeptidase YcbB/YkuD
MKTLNLTLAIVAVAAIFTSCKDDQRDIAQQKVDMYSTYVDSVSNVAAKEIAMNWEVVESDYQKNKNRANNAIVSVEENSEMQESIDESTEQYEAFKLEVEAETEAIQAANSKLVMQQSLLGSGFTGGDMKFTWINKDNILSVYDNFVTTVETNKDSYSREDWDEIKLLYEAIDTRKNTVENEGLTSADNRKIAGLKLKFAPMYTFNRMGAKSEENAAAKQ